MMFFFSMLEAIAQVIIALVIFTFTCRDIPNFYKSLYDFTFIASNIMLACFAFYYCATTIDLDVLLSSLIVLCYAVVLFIVTTLCVFVCNGLSSVVPRWRRRSERVFNESCGVRANLVDRIRFEVLHLPPTTDPSASQAEAAMPQSPYAEPNSVYRDVNRSTDAGHAPAEHPTTPKSAPPAHHTLLALVVSDTPRTPHDTLSVEDVLGRTTLSDAGAAVARMSREEEEWRTTAAPLPTPAALAVPCNVCVADTDATCLSNAHLTLSWICCLMPNSVAIPLALMQQLSSLVSWVNFSVGSTYIIMFHMVCSVVRITILPIFARRARAEAERRRLVRATLWQYRQDSRLGACHTDVNVKEEGDGAWQQGDRRNPLEELNQQSDKRSSAHEQDGGALTVRCDDAVRTVYVRVVSQADLASLRASALPTNPSAATTDAHSRGHVRHVLFNLLVDPVIFPAIIGMGLGAIPHFKHILFNGALETLTDSMLLVSNGAIAAQLLLVITRLLGPSAAVAAAIAKSDALPPAPADASTTAKDAAAVTAADATGRYQACVASASTNDAEELVAATDCPTEGQAPSCEAKQRESDRADTSSSSAAAVAVRGAKTAATTTTDRAEKPKGVKGLLYGIGRAFSLKRVDQRFFWTALFVRPVLFPALCLTLLYALNTVFQSRLQGGGVNGRICLLALIFDAISPPTTDVLRLFDGDTVMERQWEKLLRYQHLIGLATMMAWLYLSIRVFDI